MKPIITLSLVTAMFGISGVAMANDEATATIKADIAAEQKARDDAQAEIDRLRVKLEKVDNDISSHETRIEELQTKLQVKGATAP